MLFYKLLLLPILSLLIFKIQYWNGFTSSILSWEFSISWFILTFQYELIILSSARYISKTGYFLATSHSVFRLRSILDKFLAWATFPSQRCFSLRVLNFLKCFGFFLEMLGFCRPLWAARCRLPISDNCVSQLTAKRQPVADPLLYDTFSWGVRKPFGLTLAYRLCVHSRSLWPRMAISDRRLYDQLLCLHHILLCKSSLLATSSNFLSSWWYGISHTYCADSLYWAD